jgi:microsomal epoxide hydrolase
MPIRARYAALLPSLLAMLAVPASPVAAAPVSRHFTAGDGTRLHYLEAGRGPVIVFVPGWTMPAEIWLPQLAHFGAGYRAIAFDPRGQGKSDVARSGYTLERRAQDIAELIDHVGEPVVLVGWSLGVLEALAYVEAAGSARVRGLVLVDNSIGEEPPPSSDPTFLSRLKANRIATVERFVRGMFRTSQPETYLRAIVASSLRVPLEGAVALLSYPYPRERWKQIVYAIDRPILYVVTPRFAGQAANLKQNHPRAQVEVFEHAGHALFVDEAKRFNRAVERFLNDKVGPP